MKINVKKKKHTIVVGGSKMVPQIPTFQYSHSCVALLHFTRVDLYES